MATRLTRLLSRAVGAALSLPSLLASRLAAAEEDFFLGKSGRIIKLKQASSPFRRLLLNAPSLWRGEVTLVGVSLRQAKDESRPFPAEAPGLFSLFDLRNRTSLDEARRMEVDLEYLRDRSIKRDLGILVRSFLAHALESGQAAPVVPLLGIEIDNLTNDEALDRIMNFAGTRHNRQVSFVNAHCANVAQIDERYLHTLNSSELCLADGSGVKLGSAMKGYRIVENVNGTDLFPRILFRLQESGGKISLLGAKPGIVDLVAEYIERTYPGVRLGVVQHGYFKEHEEESIIQSVADSDSDILLVAFGVPGQDLWLAQHLPRLNVGVGIGVGGLFDFYSGTIPRAPSWLRSLGMEWAFRLFQEPQRLWRRYLVGNFLFLYRVMVDRSRSK